MQDEEGSRDDRGADELDRWRSQAENKGGESNDNNSDCQILVLRRGGETSGEEKRRVETIWEYRCDGDVMEEEREKEGGGE